VLVLKRVVLPALVGLLAAAVAVTGLVGASGIRADQRKAAAIAKEKKAVARFLAAARPLVIDVYDAVQPLQDVDDSFATPRAGLTAARDDVLAHGGAATSLHAVAVHLKALPVPRTLAAQAKELRAQLDALISASNALAEATRAKADTSGFVAAFGDGFEELLTAETSWLLAVQHVYGEGTTLPVPSAARTGAHGRSVATKGAFISTSDLTCTRAGVAMADLPELSEAAELVTNFPKRAKIVRTAVSALLRVPAPASAAAFEHELRVQLRASLAMASAFEQMRAAYLHADLAAYHAALRSLRAAEAASQALSRAYQTFGVSECAFFFDTGGSQKKSSSGGLSA
jgi:hypothetical protein